jgi:hypothetical protein
MMDKIISNFINIGRKMIYEILLLIFLLIAIVLETKCEALTLNFNNDTNSLLLILLPLILTIISIALSLPRGFLFGIDINDFRKLRTGITIDFLHILIISIIVFSLFTLSFILGLMYIVIALNIYIIFYSISIVVQEIPLLMKNNKHLLKILKKHLRTGIFTKDTDTVIMNLIFSKGIIFTFSKLRINKSSYDKNLLDRLLNLQSEYLIGFVENYPIMTKAKDLKYKKIDLIEAIDVSIENLNQILQFSKEFNIINIYGGQNHYYHITRSLFSLHKILYLLLDLEDKYFVKYTGLFRTMYMKIQFDEDSIDEHKFIYKVQNALLINTLSNEELWFVKLLNDYIFADSMLFSTKIDYLSFVSVYIYYLSEMEKQVSPEFKAELKQFISERDAKVNYNNVLVTTWTKKVEEIIEEMDFRKVSNLLEKLIFIYDASEQQHFWYMGAYNGVHSTSIYEEFRVELLIEWWIGSLLINEINHIEDNDNINKMFASFDSNQKQFISRYLKENWLGENDQFITDKKFRIHDFYNIQSTIDTHFKDSSLTKELASFSNNYMKEKTLSEYSLELERGKDFEKYLEILSASFKKAIDNVSFLDKELDIEDNKRVYQFLCDSKWSEKIIEMHAERMPDLLNNHISTTFNEDSTIQSNKHNFENFEEEIYPIVEYFNSEYKSHSYIGYDQVSDTNKREYLSNISTIKGPRLPNFVYLKKDAIKVNLEYLSLDSIIRNLTDEEINVIIDRDYKKIDGMYQYTEAVNSKTSIWFTRDEMINLISKKFFYVRIVFSSRIIFDYDKILFAEKIKN